MRLGVLDVGSNTVHLQVVDAAPGARPNPTINHKEEVRLAEYLSNDGFLSAEGTRLLREAIRRALHEAKKVETEELLPFATSALRDAKNGADIIAKINEDFEIDLQVLSGEDEAKITFLAARRWYGWSSGRLLMVDIGGGSLELAVGVNEVPDVAISLPLGASRLTKDHLAGDPFTKKSIRELRDHIESNIAEILPSLLQHQETDRAIATSKTLRTQARLAGDRWKWKKASYRCTTQNHTSTCRDDPRGTRRTSRGIRNSCPTDYGRCARRRERNAQPRC
jgi:exopolyphosphatase/guanosine-5'-triphosphate,3'-diphosphate pyrophosphatase